MCNLYSMTKNVEAIGLFGGPLDFVESVSGESGWVADRGALPRSQSEPAGHLRHRLFAYHSASRAGQPHAQEALRPDEIVRMVKELGG